MSDERRDTLQQCGMPRQSRPVLGQDAFPTNPQGSYRGRRRQQRIPDAREGPAARRFAVMDFRIQKEDGVDMLEGEPWQWIRTAKQFGGRSRALLPANVLRKTARSGGRGLVAGVNYRVKHREDLEISPRLHWLAKVWHAETASDLALHLRELDAVIAWDALRRPGDAEGQPWTSLQVGR